MQSPPLAGVLSAAEQAQQSAMRERESAQIAQRANADFCDQTIAPALNNWGTEKANMEDQIAFYRAQNESARTAGFVPEEAPNYPGRDAQGRYVSGAPGGVAGSPTFQGGNLSMEDVRNGLGSVVGALTDIQWKHQTLYGKPLPISPTELVRRAEAVNLDPSSYAAREFHFADKEAEITRKAAEDHDAAVRNAAVAENDRKWAERTGSNPDVRVAESSRFGDVARAVKAGQRPDPLQLNESQRRQATSQAIRHDIHEESAA